MDGFDFAAEVRRVNKALGYEFPRVERVSFPTTHEQLTDDLTADYARERVAKYSRDVAVFHKTGQRTDEIRAQYRLADWKRVLRQRSCEE